MKPDKLKPTLLNRPEFSNGEQPSPNKLNQSFKNLEIALQSLELYIGDVTGVEYANKILSGDPLTLPNMGRVLGPAGSLSPAAPMDEDFQFQAVLGTGRNEWTLPLWPKDKTDTLQLSISGATAKDQDNNSLFQTQKAEGDELKNPGEWKYVTKTNAIHTYGILATGGATAICTSHLGADKGLGLGTYWQVGNALPNVMPSFRIPTSTSIAIATSADPLYEYLVTLHPEDYTFHSPIHGTDGSRRDAATLVTDASTVEADAAGVSPVPTVTTKIPQKLPFSLEALSAGDEVPESFVTLYKDGVNGHLLTGGRVFYKDSTSFYWKGPNLDTTGVTKYRVVTAGGQQTNQLLEGLAYTVRNHKHKGPAAISHSDLLEQGYGLQASQLPLLIQGGTANGWHRPTTPAPYKGNPHPQYLMRGGHAYGVDEANLNNLMLGPFGVGLKPANARSAKVADVYAKADVESWPIDFGGRAYMKVDTGDDGKQHLVSASMEAKSQLSVTGHRAAGFGESVSLGSSHGRGRVTGQGFVIQSDASSSQTEHNLLGNTITSKILSGTRVRHDVTGLAADCTSSDSTDVSVTLIGSQSTAQITDCERSRIHLIGGAGVKFDVKNCDNLDLEVARASGTYLFDGAGLAGYRKVQAYDYLDQVVGTARITAGDYRVDAETRRETKSFLLDQWMAVGGTSATVPGKVEDWDGGFGSHGYRRLFFHGPAHHLMTPFPESDMAYFLDLEDDSHLKQLILKVGYVDASLHLLYYTIDGAVSTATSMTLPTSNGTSTDTVTWNLGPSIGTKGDRYPSLSGAAVSVALLFQNDNPVTPIANHLKLYGGTYEYDRKRF